MRPAGPGGLEPARTVKLRGLAASGLGEAPCFTELPWVKSQFLDKLGIDPCPGTFNINVLPGDLEKLEAVKLAAGFVIAPPASDFCAGKAFPAVVNGSVRGAVVIPVVPSYPRLQLEFMSSCHVRRTLALKDGDAVEVEVDISAADG